MQGTEIPDKRILFGSVSGPTKSLLSVSPSVRPSVRHFFQEWVISFFYFSHDDRLLEYLKTDKVLFSKKNNFSPNFGKKDPKWPQNRFLEKFCH